MAALDSDYELIPAAVDARLRDPSADAAVQATRIRAWLENLDAAAWVRQIAERVATDERLAARLGHHSVEHPNGFDLINLAGALPEPDRLPAYRVRLHIWWPERRGATEDAHNHAWDFSSRILAGKLRFTTYHPDKKGDEFFWYPYTLGSSGAYAEEEIQRVRLARSFDGTLPAGTCYTFNHRQLHRVAPAGDSVVATLVVTGRFLRGGSDIYTEQPRHACGARIPRAPLGADTLRTRLARLAQAL